MSIPTIRYFNDYFDHKAELRAKRRLYRAYLTGLTPGSSYSFVVYYNQTSYVSLRRSFWTPITVTEPNDELRIAIGRRMSNNLEAVEMQKMLAGDLNVDLALISGQLVFDYG